jgi:hypothetical protein
LPRSTLLLLLGDNKVDLGGQLRVIHSAVVVDFAGTLASPRRLRDCGRGTAQRYLCVGWPFPGFVVGLPGGFVAVEDCGTEAIGLVLAVDEDVGRDNDDEEV